MNYSVVKQQIHQIIITEIAKYYQKSCTLAGLELEDLKCLEIIAKMSEFEQEIKSSDDSSSTKDIPIAELLKIVRSEQSNGDGTPGST